MLFVFGVPRHGIACGRKVAKSFQEELVNSRSGAEEQQLDKGELNKRIKKPSFILVLKNGFILL